MSTQSQYATIPKLKAITISTANALRDGTGTISTLITGTPTNAGGTRVDRVQINATGDTSAGFIRFFLRAGYPGMSISSITFSGTTATLTTTAPHGLATGDLVTVQNALPDQFNVTDAVITVTGVSSFTYTIATGVTVNASPVGGYSYVKAAESSRFWREIAVTAAVVVPRTISTLTFSTTTATMTTATAHGLSVGDIITVTGASPAAYNGTFAVATVPTTTTLTYTMLSNPGSNAAPVGSYTVIKASFTRAMHSQQTADSPYFPMVLPAGHQLRVSTHNAESFNVSTTFTGDTA